MASDLFAYLPWTPTSETDVSPGSHNGYALWSGAAQALSETIRERLAFLLFRSYDVDMKPRPLTSLDSSGIASFLISCKGILDSFDGAVSADCLRIPAFDRSSQSGVKPLDWGVCGTVGEIAQIKYLQGRCYLVEGKVQDAWDCAVKLHCASSLCFQSGSSDVYMTGITFRHHSFLLLCEIVGYDGSPSIAREAIALALSAPDPNDFARAFLAPLAFRAIECLQGCSVDVSIEEALALVQRFVDGESEDSEADLGMGADVSLSSRELFVGKEASQAVRPVASAASPTMNPPRPLRLENTAELIGFACLRCVEALTCPAHAARTRLAALPYSCLPSSWPDEKKRQAQNSTTTMAALVSCLSEMDNSVGLLFVSRVAEVMCARVKRNGFFWYYPLAQHRGIAAALGVRVFAAERGSRPHHLDKLVEQGILPVVPLDPFSGDKLLFDESTDTVSGELGEPELQHWVPPVDVSKKLRWRVSAGKDQGGEQVSRR